MWTEQDRIRSYFATTNRQATSLLAMTITKIGSNQSLSDVIAMLDARSGLQRAYTVMEDEVDEFINFDINFSQHPCLYTELISLTRTTGSSVDEALSMSLEYLSNVSDVDNIFQDSLMTCLDLSS